MLFHAYLLELETRQRVSIGDIKASSEGEAIDIASKRIAVTLKNLVCRKWAVRAEPAKKVPL